MKFRNYLLVAIFTASAVVANITASKITFFDFPVVGIVEIPAGFIGIALCYLVSDTICELDGREEAHKVVNAVILSLGVAWVLVYASIYLPPAPVYDFNQEFALVMGSSGLVVLASIVTLLFSQNFDVWMFDKIRTETGGKHKWLRNIGSTAISQLLDTALFITLAFYIFPLVAGGTTFPFSVIMAMILGQYLVKLVIVLLDTPLFYILTANND